jgi:hypothetical protein
MHARFHFYSFPSQLAALNKAAEAAAAKAAKAASETAPPSPAVAWTNISKYAFEAGDYSSKKVTCYAHPRHAPPAACQAHAALTRPPLPLPLPAPSGHHLHHAGVRGFAAQGQRQG